MGECACRHPLFSAWDSWDIGTMLIYKDFFPSQLGTCPKHVLGLAVKKHQRTSTTAVGHFPPLHQFRGEKPPRRPERADASPVNFCPGIARAPEFALFVEQRGTADGKAPVFGGQWPRVSRQSAGVRGLR